MSRMDTAPSLTNMAIVACADLPARIAASNKTAIAALDARVAE